MNPVIETIKKRRSVRNFLPDPIDKSVLETLFEAASWAPSGHNTQPWHFIAIRNRSLIEEIDRAARKEMRKSDIEWIRKYGSLDGFDITFGAPVLVIVSGRTDAISWKTDCAAAIQNMLLAAESLDIGSLWLGFAVFAFLRDGLRERLGIPQGYEPFYGVALGRKNPVKPAAAPSRKAPPAVYID